MQPMAARVVDKLPEGDEWSYEVKFDGYRALWAPVSQGPLRSSAPPSAMEARIFVSPRSTAASACGGADPEQEVVAVQRLEAAGFAQPFRSTIWGF
jgi:hypothetical protein